MFYKSVGEEVEGAYHLLMCCWRSKFLVKIFSQKLHLSFGPFPLSCSAEREVKEEVDHRPCDSPITDLRCNIKLFPVQLQSGHVNLTERFPWPRLNQWIKEQ